MLPLPYRVCHRKKETSDTFTLEMTPVPPGAGMPIRPGQFNMLYAFGVGEVPISISGDVREPGRLVHTIRAVGAVSQRLTALGDGDFVGVRGPFGNPWPVELGQGRDVLVVAGGLGLAPLRPIVYALKAERSRFGRCTVLYGTRTPEDQLFTREFKAWRAAGIDVLRAVGQSTPKWRETVGHVTALIPLAQFEPGNTVAFLCGPELMMRFTSLDLIQRGIPGDRVFLSMERNMKCAIGFCGHCQWGPEFMCLQGPVFPFTKIERWLRVREF
jgi:NAD(P)H-flavin reductase